jgi:hypothetical protein
VETQLAEDHHDPTPSSSLEAERANHGHLSLPLRVADPIQPSDLLGSMHIRVSSMDVDKSPMRDAASEVEDPMSVSRPSPSLMRPGICMSRNQCVKDEAGSMGTGQASSGWGGLMSFLTDHAVDVSMASCKKASKPRTEA